MIKKENKFFNFEKPIYDIAFKEEENWRWREKEQPRR